MAIYHLEAKVISRGVGRSAVAASAYMSCSRIYNDYDGIQHDYTRKQGLIYEQVLLPLQAPPEWKDRSVLWNAVEETEKTKDSRLAREFVVALPMELSKEENISLLTEYVQENFVNNGMCADFCIHDTDGHNPHAHIMLTVRPLDENGKWQRKTEKEYLCIKDGEERGFTSSEFKTAQLDGWEKQYQYIVGKKKVYMPPSVAEQQGYERASKYPKSTRYGRQNPIAEKWNSEEQLQIWRKNWADINNLYLEHKNIDERIDHRSHKERGVDEQPTIHEGVTARIIEQKGGTSERCEINRQIKADNKLLRELKEIVKNLAKAVIDTIPKIADALETMRINIAFHIFGAKVLQSKQWRTQRKIDDSNKTLDEYTKTANSLKDKIEERSKTVEKKNAIPKYRFIQHNEYARLITTQTEEIEEIKSEKNRLLKKLNCEADGDIKGVKKAVAEMEKSITKLKEQKKKHEAEIQKALAEFAEVKEKAKGFDELEVIDYRLAVRDAKKTEYFDSLEKQYGKDYYYSDAAMSLADADIKLREDLPETRTSIRWRLKVEQQRQKHEERRQQRKPKQRSKDDWDMEL